MSVCDSYSESNVNNYSYMFSTYFNALGQSFTGDGNTLDYAKFYIKKVGSPTGNIYAKVYEHSGTFGTSSVPTGSAIAVSDAVDISTISTTESLVTFNFSGSARITLSGSTYYVVTTEYTGGDLGNCVQVGYDDSSPSHAGNFCGYFAGSWSAFSGSDAAFYVYSFVSGSTTLNSKINIGDSWKDVAAAKINIGDTWKDVAAIKINIGDSWKTIY